MTLSIRARADASCGRERSGETIENSSEARPSLSQSSPTSARRRHLTPCLSNQRDMKIAWFFLASAVGVSSRMTAEIDMRQRTESPITMRVDEAAPQQTFAQIDVFVAPSPIAVGKTVSRREMPTLHEDDTDR